MLVSTLPPRLLVHSVSFWPALKEEEAAVMRQTHTWMGDTVKAALTYSSPFWRERELAGALHSQCGPCTQLYDQTSHHHSHQHGALVRQNTVGVLDKQQRQYATSDIQSFE